MERIVFTITLPGNDRRHFVDEDDVRVVLARLPAEATARLRGVHFNDRSRGGRVLGYTNRGRREVAITALPPRFSLTRALVPPQRAEHFGAWKGAQWPPLAVRRFVLYDVLLHEIGHLQVIHPGARDERRRFAMEPRAEAFAEAWRQRLWAAPFEHDDPVHRAPAAEEIAALARYPEAHAEYGRGLAASGEAARAHHARAVELFPGHAAALEALAVDAAGRGDPERAAGHLRAALRVDPVLWRTRLRLAMALLALDEPEEARRHLERARRQFVPTAATLALYANTLADAGFFDEGSRHFQRSLDKDPERAGSFVDFARAIWDLEPPTEANAARALALFERAVALAPGSARAHLYLARALAGRPGETARAVHHAEEALRLRPGDEVAAALLELLRGPLPGGQEVHLARGTLPQRAYPR